jgi:tRNA (guanine10-N2)-dimethyltransferase
LKVVKLFFLLSGEHESLPLSELKAILEAEGYAYSVVEKLDQIVRIEADLRCIDSITHRSAFTRLCCLELLNCSAEIACILRSAQQAHLKGILKQGESFAVRVKRVRRYAAELSTMVLEEKLGQLILKANTGAVVNLRKPDKTFVGILSNERLVFGLKLAEIRAKPFVERRPRKKPFFHPSAMPPRLARCMVNLTRVKAGDLVFDPFCGTGSMLVEAGLVGCRVLGSDVQRRMVNGAIRNINYFNIEPEGVVVADARDPSFSKVDSVVTDPPYGRSTITLKRATDQIVKEALAAAIRLLDKGQKVCIASPKTLNIVMIGTCLGYKHLESYFVYVHRTLTREIALFEKT